MPFDGGFCHKIAAELNAAVDCHIDKIYQPSRDELVFLLRKKGFAKRLLISAKSGAARVQFTDIKYENPDVPPMFCMLLRKHFSSARLVSIFQPSLERILRFKFETTNEMGDRVSPEIICELIGNQSNIVLLDSDGRIIDAIRRSDIEVAARIIQPGAVYEHPRSQGKLNPLDNEISVIAEKCLHNGELPLSRGILSVIDGFSPLIAREIAYSAYGIDPIISEINDYEPFKNELIRVISDIGIAGSPTLVNRIDGGADFSYTDIKQYGSDTKRIKYESFSELLDAFYSERELKSRINHAASDVLKTVNNARARAVKRLSLRKKELEDCADREQNRIFGELLKANLYMIEAGSNSATVQNYYDPDLKTVEIPLNPAISPAANAAKYFKEYKKSHTAEQTLIPLIAEDEQEIVYLDTVLESLERCDSLADISEIREELYDGGYMRRKSGGPRKSKQNTGIFRELLSSEGYRVLIGKNNRQNDYITTKLASKGDLWFHTKNIAGSHIVVMSGGGEISDETIVSAAKLAAFYSKASASSNVAVDYTPIKYVKKPNGAKAGMVIYTTNQTVFVTPDKNAFNKGESNL